MRGVHPPVSIVPRLSLWPPPGWLKMKNSQALAVKNVGKLVELPAKDFYLCPP